MGWFNHHPDIFCFTILGSLAVLLSGWVGVVESEGRIVERKVSLGEARGETEISHHENPTFWATNIATEFWDFWKNTVFYGVLGLLGGINWLAGFLSINSIAWQYPSATDASEVVSCSFLVSKASFIRGRTSHR